MDSHLRKIDKQSREVEKQLLEHIEKYPIEEYSYDLIIGKMTILKQNYLPFLLTNINIFDQHKCRQARKEYKIIYSSRFHNQHNVRVKVSEKVMRRVRQKLKETNSGKSTLFNL